MSHLLWPSISLLAGLCPLGMFSVCFNTCSVLNEIQISTWGIPSHLVDENILAEIFHEESQGDQNNKKYLFLPYFIFYPVIKCT